MAITVGGFLYFTQNHSLVGKISFLRDRISCFMVMTIKSQGWMRMMRSHAD